MLSFDLGRPDRLNPEIVAGPLLLRAATAADAPSWIDLRQRSRRHLTQWEPDWRSDEMTLEAFRQRLKGYERERKSGGAMPMLIFRQSDMALVGGVNLAQIRYLASCSATIGYWIGEPFLRLGFGRAAVEGVCNYAFAKLGLNRVEAACQPDNIASRHLLERVGFLEEGLARDYLFINGDWRDHCIYALTARSHAAPHSTSQ